MALAPSDKKDNNAKATQELVSTLEVMGYEKEDILHAIHIHQKSKLYISEYINVSILVDIIIRLKEEENSYWVHLQNKCKISAIYNESKDNYNPNEHCNRCNMVDAIRQTCIDNMIILCKLVRDVNHFELLQQYSIDIYNTNINYNSNYNDEKCSDLNINTLKMISNIISNKWFNCPIIRTTYKSVSNLIDNYENMRYFYSKIDEIMHINYIPNIEDIKRYKKSKMFVVSNDKSNYTNRFNNSETIYYHDKDATKLFVLPLFSNANIGFSVEIPDIFKHRFFDPINRNPFVKKIQVAKIFNSKTK
eukprot:341616_1